MERLNVVKVKELIEKLQRLDQDKDIHIIYDAYGKVGFDIEIQAKKSNVEGVNVGDYVINAW